MSKEEKYQNLKQEFIDAGASDELMDYIEKLKPYLFIEQVTQVSNTNNIPATVLEQIEEKWPVSIDVLKKEHNGIGIQSIRDLSRVNEYRKEGALYGYSLAQPQWIPINEAKLEIGVLYIGHSPHWVDADYNTKGIRQFFKTDDMGIVSSTWNNYQDCWESDYLTKPTHYIIPESPIK